MHFVNTGKLEITYCVVDYQSTIPKIDKLLVQELRRNFNQEALGANLATT